MSAPHRRLTVHVLDATRGVPAVGVRVSLARLGGAAGVAAELARTRTDADGRSPTPLLAGDDLTSGDYEISFALGDYFGLADRFLDIVPVRFVVRDTDLHVHIAVLATAWSYTTYRGS